MISVNRQCFFENDKIFRNSDDTGKFHNYYFMSDVGLTFNDLHNEEDPEDASNDYWISHNISSKRNLTILYPTLSSYIIIIRHK